MMGKTELANVRKSLRSVCVCNGIVYVWKCVWEAGQMFLHCSFSFSHTVLPSVTAWLVSVPGLSPPSAGSCSQCHVPLLRLHYGWDSRTVWQNFLTGRRTGHKDSDSQRSTTKDINLLVQSNELLEHFLKKMSK